MINFQFVKSVWRTLTNSERSITSSAETGKSLSEMRIPNADNICERNEKNEWDGA